MSRFVLFFGILLCRHVFCVSAQYYRSSKNSTPNFVIEGLREVNFTSDGTNQHASSAVYDYSEGETLNLTCRLTLISRPHPYEYMHWNFAGKIFAPTELKNSKEEYVKINFGHALTKDDNRKNISCEAQEKVTPSTNQRKRHVITLTLALREPQVPGSSERSNQNNTTNITFQLNSEAQDNRVQKRKTVCLNKDSIDVQEGDKLLIVATRRTYINFGWCYVMNKKNSSNLWTPGRENRTVKLDKNKKVVQSNFTVEINVTRSIEGQWNCTFLTDMGGHGALPLYSYTYAKINGVDKVDEFSKTNCTISVRVTEKKPAAQDYDSATESTTLQSQSTVTTKIPTRSTRSRSTANPRTTTTSITHKTSPTSVLPVTVCTETTSNDHVTDKPGVSMPPSPLKPGGVPLSEVLKWAIPLIIASVIIMFVMVWLCLRRQRHDKEEKLMKDQSDVTYDNLEIHNERQFPPNLESTYAKPQDCRDVEEESPYAVSANHNESGNYSVPYIEKDLNELYSKPLPKNQRKKPEPELYSQVIPKSQRKMDENKSVLYAEASTGLPETEYSNTRINNTAIYSHVLPKNDGKYVNVKGTPKYGNVFQNDRYVNSNESDYAEPAYCELGNGNIK